MAESDVLDLDLVRAAIVAEAAPVEYRPVKLYDRTWRIRKEPNLVSIMEFAETGGMLTALLGYVHAEDRDALTADLKADESLDDAVLEAILDAFMREETGRPTAPSSTSAPLSSPSGVSSTDTSWDTVVPVSPPSP